MLSRAPPLSAGSGGGAAARRATAPTLSPSFRSQLSSHRPLLSRPLSLRRRGHSLVTRQQQSEGSGGAWTATTTTSTKTVDATPTPPPTCSAPDADNNENADAAPSSSSPSSSDNAKFDWRRCWYPVSLVESLKTDRPNALQLLGEPLVAWKPLGGRKSGKGESGGDGDGDDGSGWVVQRDACPHRLAPLSEGRLETDQTIQCSYHGWRFGPEGNLALVPQLAGADPTAHARACSGGGGGARGCVAVHPSRVVDGVLWAWAEPGGGEEVARRAAAAWPPASMPPEMVAGGAADGADAAPDAAPATAPWTANSLGWYTRDVPLSAEMIVENFLDAAHVPWSHHGVMGSRDAPDQTITMNKSAAEKEKTPTRAEAAAVRGGGFTVRVQPPAGRAAYGLSFVPPGLVRYDFGGVAMLLHVTPTSPGRSRIFLTVIEPPRAQRQPASALPLTQRLGRFLASLDPRTLKNRWIPLYHATNRNAALDGDALLLYRAQELLQRGWGIVGAGGGASASAPTETTTTTTGHGVDWRRLYYMPSSADLAVAALRRWLDGPGSALPVLPANAAALGLAPPPPLSRLEVFDRYEQHTKHCPHCLRALSACNRALGFLALAGLAAFTVAVWFLAGAAMAAGGPSVAGAKAAASAGVSALCAWAASALWRLRMLFIVYDYQHAEH